jgi:hypothetical protein
MSRLPETATARPGVAGTEGAWNEVAEPADKPGSV